VMPTRHQGPSKFFAYRSPCFAGSEQLFMLGDSADGTTKFVSRNLQAAWVAQRDVACTVRVSLHHCSRRWGRGPFRNHSRAGGRRRGHLQMGWTGTVFPRRGLPPSLELRQNHRDWKARLVSADRMAHSPESRLPRNSRLWKNADDAA
jgi:hypothetical protein